MSAVVGICAAVERVRLGAWDETVTEEDVRSRVVEALVESVGVAAP